MSMTPEGKAKKLVKDLLKEYLAYVVMPIGSVFGKSGVPDFIVCYKRQFIGIEVKADTDVTQLQQDNLDAIVKAGGHAIVVRRTSKGVVTGLDELRLMMDFISEQWI